MHRTHQPKTPSRNIKSPTAQTPGTSYAKRLPAIPPISNSDPPSNMESSTTQQPLSRSSQKLPALPHEANGNPNAVPPTPPREPKIKLIFEHPKQTYQPPLKGKVIENPINNPEEKTICLKFDPPKDDLDSYETDIGRLLIGKKLPFCVRMKADFQHGSMLLTKGMLLSLQFIHRPYRVYATDQDNKEYHLPICARQLYEVLPIDPIHDDTLYENTLDLIKARPLPRRVRIEEAQLSVHPGEGQERGEILEIEKIERRPVPMGSDEPSQLVLIGSSNGYPFAFSESMDLSAYTTMPSIDFMSLSEIVKKFPLPLRVRKADNQKFVMILHRLDEEYHVIATSANLYQVFSIPATWEGEIEAVENSTLEQLLQSMLPPLYTLVNTTWGLKELGRRELQPNMRQVAQPLQEIMESWSRTQEGREFVLDASKTAVESLKSRVEELMETKTRLNNELNLYRVEAPAPPPRANVHTDAPPVPPRLKSPTSPTAPLTLPKDSGVYEVSLPFQDKGQMHVKSTRAQEELKNLLGTREMENKRLREKVATLEGEIRLMVGKNESLVDQIRNLQDQIDKLKTDPMYETLNSSAASAAYANPNGGPLYGQMGIPTRPSTLGSLDEGAVCNLLREIRLEKYLDVFKENSVNGELLATLDEEDLYGELGMGRLHAKRLLIEVKKRKK